MCVVHLCVSAWPHWKYSHWSQWWAGHVTLTQNPFIKLSHAERQILRHLSGALPWRNTFQQPPDSVMYNKGCLIFFYQPIITCTAAFQILCQCSVTSHCVMPEIQVGYNTIIVLICHLVTYRYWIEAHSLILYTKVSRNPKAAIKNIHTSNWKKKSKAQYFKSNSLVHVFEHWFICCIYISPPAPNLLLRNSELQA